MIQVEKIKTQVYLNKEMHMEFEGININITRFTRMEDESAWEIPMHAHLNYELHYIYEGTGKVGLGNNTFDISAGEFYICPPFIDHSQKTDDVHPMKEYCIECSLDAHASGNAGNECLNLLQTINRMLYCKHYDSGDTLKKNFTLLNGMLGEKCSINKKDELLVKSLILNTILSMLIFSKREVSSNEIAINQNDINYQRASAIKNYLEANYKQNISVKDCTRIFYHSERQIDRIMMKIYNETFHEVLTKFRVKIAINLLQTTNYSVDIIAAEAGFTGYRQMLRAFKCFGLELPTKLRKNNKWNEVDK